MTIQELLDELEEGYNTILIDYAGLDGFNENNVGKARKQIWDAGGKISYIAKKLVLIKDFKDQLKTN